MVEFLKGRVESNQGISLQKLTGHLSQLPHDLRTKYGCTLESLKMFLREYPKVFLILNESNVYVRTESLPSTSALTGSVESFTSSTSDRGTDKKDVTCLTDVRGTVHRMFNVYGFISVEQPIKTTVYFDVQSFENAKYTSLSSSGLQVGDSVILDAKRGCKDCKVEFRASRVNRLSTTKVSSSCLSPHSVTGKGGSDCNTITQLVNQDGVIEMVKPNYGFIKFGSNQEERAFFHANVVDKSLGQSIKNLLDVLTVEDKVRFDAKPCKKPSGKVKWGATSVYLCRGTDNIDITDSDDELLNEVFMSDDESETLDLLAKLGEYESRKADFKKSPVGHADRDASSAEAESLG